jgi:hypothetical protein
MLKRMLSGSDADEAHKRLELHTLDACWRYANRYIVGGRPY